MRRTSSLLAAAALAATTLTVPTAAHADVSDAKLTVSFDRLAEDRVAKISVRVTSASGVTGVQAHGRYESSTAEPYATLDLKRTQGTDTDGVWEGEIRPDVAARPGTNVVDTVITTADGATTLRRAWFIDCFTTSVEGLAAAPAVVDVEHPDVALSGRLMVQKSHDRAPEPVQGLTVDAYPAQATTAADGSFVLRTQGGADVHLQAQGPYCALDEDSPASVRQQATEISVRMTPGSTVAPYTEMSVDGKVLRHGSAGLAPAAGVTVALDLASGLAEYSPPQVKTAADGTFHAFFTAARGVGSSGAVAVEAKGGEFLTGSRASLGTLNIRNKAAIDDFVLRGAPMAYGDPIVADGTLTIRPDYTGVTNLPVYLEYSWDGKTGWKTWAQQTLPLPKSFFFDTSKPVTKDAYWRFRYPGGPLNTPAVSPVKYVDVKYRTQIYDFNASPEPVKKGKSITVKGLLNRFMDKAVPGPNAPVSIYFKPSGSSKWTQMAVVKTASNGWFSKVFKASKDGTWMASYNGSANYFASNKPSDYVDVR
ncbi:hypothetical protein [Actinomadura verrucosospora]|uniref:Carboxypeptidase regulatory-like domain-containing protein n=1 Tax=Actinomadura verrucosospora TaxID=46165 RepID=A0A7D4ARW9_ACTVE|nr:hypothetical protein [Actinomadura verrucosospora]QKG23569.1 hypothetical protein ACTIVE_5212 [Actinomadura verrucosospora]